MKKLILFGSGVYGLKMLEYFGRDNVEAFCDNECVAEDEKYGVRRIPFKKLTYIAADHIIILSVNSKNAEEIAQQLDRNKVDDFLICDEEMQDDIKKYGPGEYLEMLRDDTYRMKKERNEYRSLFYNKKNEYETMKSLSDITKLKKATGYISHVQKRLLAFTGELFAYFEDAGLGIKPFVAAGTAIGKYRHNGFIPWDDDMDFGLFRNDYMRLLEYGRKNFVCIDCYASINDDDNRNIEYALRDNPGRYIMTVSLSCIRILKGTSMADCDVIDFFPYDHYDSSYDYDEHLELIRSCEKYRYTIRGRDVTGTIIESNEHIVEDGALIYFGLDGMDSYVCPHRGWIKKDDMLPLVPIGFEGVPCFAPRDMEKYLWHCFEDYKGYPDSISCIHMQQVSGTILKTDYLYAGIHASAADDVDEYMGIYELLRRSGVFCVFYHSEKDYMNAPLIDRLTGKCVQYRDGFDPAFDIVIGDDGEAAGTVRMVPAKDIDASFLKKIKNDGSIPEIKRDLIICKGE